MRPEGPSSLARGRSRTRFDHCASADAADGAMARSALRPNGDDPCTVATRAGGVHECFAHGHGSDAVALGAPGARWARSTATASSAMPHAHARRHCSGTRPAATPPPDTKVGAFARVDSRRSATPPIDTTRSAPTACHPASGLAASSVPRLRARAPTAPPPSVRPRTTWWCRADTAGRMRRGRPIRGIANVPGHPPPGWS